MGGLVKELEKFYFYKNKMATTYNYRIGDRIEIHYTSFGDTKAFRIFRGELIAKIKNEKTLQCRYVCVRNFKGVIAKFSIDIHSPRLYLIKLITRRSIDIKRSKQYIPKNIF